LYIPGWQGDLSAGAGGSAKGAGIEEIKGEIKGSYATKIQGLLIVLDDLTQTIMLNFRSVYVVFASDPCGNGIYLQRQVERLVVEQQRLSMHRSHVRVFIELAKNQPDRTVEILMLYKEIAGDIGGSPALEATKIEIAEARQLAEQWAKR
jgi:hypothetical protein